MIGKPFLSLSPRWCWGRGIPCGRIEE